MSAANLLKQMTPFTQTVSLLCSIILAYLWLGSNFLRPLALQGFAASILIYLLLKWLHRQPWWHLAPHMLSGEMTVLTFGFLILVGATGNFNSIFYPLAYVHLFLVVFTTQTASSLAILIALLVFHYALGNSPHPHLWADFLALPLTWVIFVFTRYQYQVLKQERTTLIQEEEQLIHQEEDVFSFFENTLRPHLEYIKQILNLSPEHPELTTSLQTIEIELGKIEAELKTSAEKKNETPSSNS